MKNTRYYERERCDTAMIPPVKATRQSFPDIECQTIIGHAEGPHLLIIGGVHGDEWEPMVACRRLIRLFAQSLEQGCVTIAPVVNPEAFHYGRRAANDGRDLARTFPGKADGSITERVAARVTRLIQSVDYLIDLHTAGVMGQIVGLSGYMLHSDPKILEQQRQMARAFNVPVIWGTPSNVEGRSLSVARDAGIPSIYAEISGGSACDLKAVERYVDGCLNVAGGLGLLRRPAPASVVQYVVEDKRDASGFLQGMHPAPWDGFFEPAVKPGDRIVSEGLLGRISDTLGERVEDMRAQKSGVVLFIRTLPSVRKGDALGGVLEIDGPGERYYE